MIPRTPHTLLPRCSRRLQSSVTICLALIFTCTAALLCAFAESARTAGARFYVANMAESAIDSLFSQYHPELWQVYRLFGYEFRDEAASREELEKFMKPYADDCGWYCITEPEAAVTETTFLTDSGGSWFEQEVVDYLRFGWITLDHTPESASELWKQVTEAQTMDAIIKDYGLQSRKAVAMEKAIGKIHSNVIRQHQLKSRARDEVRGGNNNSFQHTAQELESCVGELPHLIERFDSAADAFAKKMDQLDERNKERLEKLEPENRKAVEEQVAAYREYTDVNGVRRLEIDVLDDNNPNELQTIESVREFANETEAYIEEMEEEDDDEDQNEGAESSGGGGGGGVDADALWAEVADAWDEVVIPELDVEYGIGDEETEGLLEGLLTFTEKGFLNLVIPEGRTVSDGKISMKDLPSQNDVTERTGGEASPLTALAVDEYAGKMLPSFTDDSKRAPAYELEYTVIGGDSDADNLTGTVLELLAIREALNFIHIMRDSSLKTQAHTLALEISAATGVPELVFLLECLVIAAWAMLEALMDLRLMLSGKKTAIIKTKNDWMVSADDFIPILISTVLHAKLPEDYLKEPAVGVSYEAWLKLLLLTQSSEHRNYRIMDMIQTNIVRDDPDFRMKNCLYGMHAEVRCSSRHLFTKLGFTSESEFGLAPSFDLREEVVKAY